MYRPADSKTINTEVWNWSEGVRNGNIVLHPTHPLIAPYVPAFIPAHLWMLVGYTSAGKSQLISQFECDAASREIPVLSLSVEDSRMEKQMSRIAVITGIHKANLLLGKIDGYEEAIANAMTEIERWPLYTYDEAYTLAEIESLITLHKPKILVIDYVQNLKLAGNGIYDRISSAAPTMFSWGSKYGITTICVSQVPNTAATDQEQELIPTKGAGELAAACHAAIIIKKGRVEGKYSDIEIHVRKNKAFGKCGVIEAEFNKTWTEIVPKKVYHQMHTEKMKNRAAKDE